MATKNQTNTSTNLAPNVASALCYAPFVGWIAAIVLFIVEKNAVVKWHAVQSLLVSLALLVLGLVLPFTVVLIFLVPFLWIFGLVLSLILTVKAYQGNAVKLPVLSGWADKVVKKI
ncbi:MAG: hypothetical protein UU93_C0004G0014 [Candidatus Amesbacteria bacterium GW2011_GWA2_42_12]|uniref:DUF4870 domain-containing protein n=1 Tax=Candidatus Amesbacteria bacterium GW2011_GWA2_42_12 TaxID=1618356 RepID=A0A0G0Y884_9BACT|nr:MAG: hypothetical protein UU93_C0004G0014 [Candidatus Amesbacteria bacterium GW2011_GWA2_42_12]